MTTYFTLSEAATRYNKFRPKVHGIIYEWLNQHIGDRKFKNAIDIACGTGDSLVPLTKISHYALGIDGSEEMLIHAREKGLNVINSQYNQIKTDIKFDLITTCMAFHWFETDKAILEFKRISSENSIWLIYNFTFNGHENSDDFKRFFENYLVNYPSPKRNKYSSVIPPGTQNLHKIASGNGTIPLHFDVDQLVGYLTTQSNIEHAIQNGRSYEQIEFELKSQLQKINNTPKYIYGFTYELHQYKSAQQGDAPEQASPAR